MRFPARSENKSTTLLFIFIHRCSGTAELTFPWPATRAAGFMAKRRKVGQSSNRYLEGASVQYAHGAEHFRRGALPGACAPHKKTRPNIFSDKVPESTRRLCDTTNAEHFSRAVTSLLYVPPLRLTQSREGSMWTNRHDKKPLYSGACLSFRCAIERFDPRGRCYLK